MKNKLSRFAVPYEVWMAIFVVAPILIMVIYAFSSSEGGFTLDNFVQMGGYTQVFLRSFKLAIIATLICLVIGYPVSYLMSREGPAFQRTAMVLIMLPMWMNFLLRTYSWMTILENHGLLNQLFEKIGLISLYNHLFGTELEYFSMMNTQGAVVLGMVYNYLPFMILPIYSVIIKLDGSLLEAARDLGLTLREGVYFYCYGPQYETPAEIRAARILGGDAVGMSTAPEVIVAAHCGMEVLGLTLLSNMAAGILDQPLSEQEVLDAAEAARETFSGLVRACLPKL